MDHPLDHDSRLNAWVDSTSRALLLLDYDGTLTPITTRPDQAKLALDVRRLLSAMAHHRRFVVAIQSGRALGDIEGLVGIDGVIFAGNHGLEIRGPDVWFTEPAAQASAPSLRELTDALEKSMRTIPGAWVENKGLTASVHVRETPPHLWADVRRIVDEAVELRSPSFRVTTGLAVFEIRPRSRWDKGAASHWIMERFARDAGLVVVIGDDATDEDAFRALPDSITVKVGDDRETLASYRVASPADVAKFLGRLLEKADRDGDDRRDDRTRAGATSREP